MQSICIIIIWIFKYSNISVFEYSNPILERTPALVSADWLRILFVC